ncbi:MAG: hypothetical protein ACQETI_12640 [Halobacteriota archaeon]
MPSTVGGYALGVVRFVLVAAGAVLSVGTIYTLVTIPPAPPGSDGFVTGMAYLFGGIILVLSLGATGLGIALPTLVGANDPLGFNRYQRGILKVASVCFVGGFLAAVVVAVASRFELGMFVLFAGIVFGVFAVCIALAWRLGEAGWAAIGRASSHLDS